MKRWKHIIVVVALMTGIVSMLPVPNVSAVNVFDNCKDNTDNTVCKSSTDQAPSMIKTIINILLYILGIIAVIMIIVGGMRYTTSNGNASQLKEAKDTILYSVVGLVVAILSFTIVNFVLGWFK